MAELEDKHYEPEEDGARNKVDSDSHEESNDASDGIEETQVDASIADPEEPQLSREATGNLAAGLFGGLVLGLAGYLIYKVSKKKSDEEIEEIEADIEQRRDRMIDSSVASSEAPYYQDTPTPRRFQHRGSSSRSAASYEYTSSS